MSLAKTIIRSLRDHPDQWEVTVHGNVKHKEQDITLMTGLTNYHLMGNVDIEETMGWFDRQRVRWAIHRWIRQEASKRIEESQ